MSDYLSHLVLRQISPEVGVRPRIASLFAPSEQVPEEGVGITVSAEEREAAGPAQRYAAPAARWTAVSRALAPRPEEGRRAAPSGALGRDHGPMSAPGLERAAAEEPSAVVSVMERGLTIEASGKAPSEQRSTLENAPALTGASSPLPTTREEGDTIEGPEALKPPSVARAAVTPRSIRKALRIGEAPLNDRGTPAERQGSVELPAPARMPVGSTSPASAPGSTTMPDAAAHGEVRVMSRREAAPMREEAGTADRASSEGSVSPRSPDASRGTEAQGPIRGSAFQLQAGREAAAPLPAALESSSAPVVQVTIGRIEVRAVTPPAPPKPAPARSVPAMSLDEYLQRRNGGKR
jgi:hypothetical protein